MKKRGVYLVLAPVFLAAFALFTGLVQWVDVRPIGPQASKVGFATFNGFVRERVGVNFTLYTVTDWLGLVPIAIALGFAFLGAVQCIRRKGLFKVDKSLFVLGAFYILVMAVFLFFETVVVNYRPVLIEGRLEASYPSSTTMLAMCVIPTAMLQCNARIKRGTLKYGVLFSLAAFGDFMVIARFLSGVHWASDILGGLLFSAGAVCLYAFFAEA